MDGVDKAAMVCEDVSRQENLERGFVRTTTAVKMFATTGRGSRVWNGQFLKLNAEGDGWAVMGRGIKLARAVGGALPSYRRGRAERNTGLRTTFACNCAKRIEKPGTRSD